MSLNAVMPIEMVINAMGYPEFKATEYTVAAPVVVVTN
jgi:hypothetical protein